MARIIAPNKEYAGVSAGVSFTGGEGHTDNEYLIKWFRDHGYEVIKEPAADMETDLEAGSETDPEAGSETDPENERVEDAAAVPKEKPAVAPAQKKDSKKEK